MSLFLGPDCGPREGAIRLPPEKLSTTVPPIPEEETPPVSPLDGSTEPQGIVNSLGRKVGRKLSGMFASRVPEEHVTASTSTPAVPLATTPGRSRGFSRTSVATGSAYGYGGSYRPRLNSQATLRPTLRRGSQASYRGWRRGSSTGAANSEGPVSASFATSADLNFAQKLLMANENTVTNIADLWVAAAINTENEEVFEDEEWDYDPMATEQPSSDTVGDELSEADIFDTNVTFRGNRFTRRPSVETPLLRNPAISSPLRPSTSRHRASPAGGARRMSNAIAPSSSVAEAAVLQTPARRYSTTTAPIFSHVGVRTPPAVIEAQQLLALADDAEVTGEDMLPPIAESQRASEDAVQPVAEPSLMSQLPILIIFQYGLLALHSTTHDQVFYLYLVSRVSPGYSL